MFQGLWRRGQARAGVLAKQILEGLRPLKNTFSCLWGIAIIELVRLHTSGYSESAVRI